MNPVKITTIRSPLLAKCDQRVNKNLLIQSVNNAVKRVGKEGSAEDSTVFTEIHLKYPPTP